jgi:hypothetical protein
MLDLVRQGLLLAQLRLWAVVQYRLTPVMPPVLA